MPKTKKTTFIKKLKAAKDKEEIITLYRPVIISLIIDILMSNDIPVMCVVPTKVHIFMFASQEKRLRTMILEGFEKNGFIKMDEEILYSLISLKREEDDFLIKLKKERGQ